MRNRKKMIKTIFIAGILANVMGFAVKAIFADSAVKKLMLYNLNGDLHRSIDATSNLSGKQNVIYAFWSFTCKPCMKEIPELIELQKTHSNLKIYYVNVLDEKNKVMEYAQKTGMHKSDILLDQLLVASEDFETLNESGQPILPQLFCLNNQNLVVFHYSGFTEENLKNLKKFLEGN